MKILLRLFTLLLSGAVLLRPSGARAQDAGGAFSCDGTLYQVRQSGTGSGAFSVLYRVDRSAAAYTTTPITGGTFGATGTLNVSGTKIVVNALAYNSQNGYLYAVAYPIDNGTPSLNPRLYQIGLGGVKDLGKTNLPAASFAAGTFDKNGNYYLTPRDNSSNNNLYRLNVASATPGVATILPLRNSGDTAAAGVILYDVAYNPVDNNLYGVFAAGLLYKLVFDNATSPTKAVVTTIGTATGETIGTDFFDVSGRLYAYSNGAVGTANSGKFYIVDTGTGAFTQISNIDPVESSDGASCINPNQRIDVVKAVTGVTKVNNNTFDVSFNIQLRNTGTVTDDNVQVSDLLWGNAANTTFPTATSVVISGLTVSGLLTANAGFTGASGAAGLLTGNQSLTAGQQATISFTARVVFPAGAVPAAQSNTAYATSTNTGPNPGYTQTSTGILLPPNNLVANDASTNGAVLPPLRADFNDPGDAPSPSPIVFPASITGTVFEDVNYGGGAGRDLSTSAGIGRGGARVELYSGTGTTATFASATTTDATGAYSFEGLAAGAAYTVRVVNSTVASSRTGAVAGLLPVQTYIYNNVNRVGGEAPELADAGNGDTGTQLGVLTAGTLTPESIVPLTLSSTIASPTANVNFGFNFDLVVNNKDAGQGSLRQFIINSNALGGEGSLAQVYTPATGATTALTTGLESSIFMIPNGAVVAGQRTGLTNSFTITTGTSKAVAIALASALPAVTGMATAIDGATQTRSTGNSNAAVATATAESTGPEVILNLSGQTGLAFAGANEQLLNLGVTGSASASSGVFVNGTATGLSLASNTIYSNGVNVSLLSGATGTTVANNVIRNSTLANGGGIVAQSGTSGNVFTQNTFDSNTGLAIDLTNGTIATGDDKTANDTNDTDAGANGLANFPVIQKAVLDKGVLTVTGFARPNALVELYLAAADVTNFGEGQTYLTSFTQGPAAGTVGAVATGAPGTYGAAGATTTGLAQGTDNTNTFTFTYTPTAAQLTLLTTSAVLTSTATLSPADGAGNFGTSEFSGNARVLFAPLPKDVTNASIATGSAVKTVLNQNLSAMMPGFLNNATLATANSIDTYTITPVTNGTLFYNNAPVTVLTTLPAANISQLTFTPAVGFTGNAVFTYTAVDANGTASTDHTLLGATTASGAGGPATYTIPVGNTDVTTTITGPASLNAGQPSGTYTATFTNNGPPTALTVTQKVTLPVGATMTAAQITASGGTFAAGNATTGGILTFPTSASLAPGASLVRQFAFTAPTTPTTTASITSTVGTATPQSPNVAPDMATLNNIVVNAVADVATTITGTTPVAVGATATFTANFNNILGPQSADGVVGKVQLPLGLANVVASSGTYDATTGVVTYTIGTLAKSPTATTYTITYTQPAYGVTATSSISTTTYEAGLTANNAVTVTIAPPATTIDVATTIGGPATATAGAQVTYNVTTNNVGTGTAASVVQTVTLPTGAANIYVTGGGAVSGTTITFPTIAALAAGQAVNRTVSFTAPGAAAFGVTANVTATSDVATTGNNIANVNTTTAAPAAGSANLYTRIGVTGPAANGNSVTAGTALTFTVTQGNKGPNQAVGVVSQVALPTGLPIVVGGAASLQLNGSGPTAVTGTVATYAAGTYDSGTGLVTFTALGTQESDATPASYTLAFNAPVSGVVTATASVSSTTPDVMMSNNVASTQVTIEPAATDLVVTLTGPDLATQGQRVTYTAKLVNNGPSAASGISWVVSIPAGLPTVVGSAASLQLNGGNPTAVTGTVATYAVGTYDSSTGLVTFTNITTQTAGIAASYTIVYNVPANGNASLVNTARATSLTNDLNAANNVAPVITAIQLSADVQVALTGPSSAVFSSATVGAPVTYGVTTTNNGPSVAGSVATTVQIPSGLLGVTVIGYDGTTLANSTITGYSAADGIVRFPAVANQASGGANASSGSISFVVPTTVTLTNTPLNILTPAATAVLTGTVPDPNLTNNSATVVTTFSAPTTASVDLSVAVAASTGTATAGGAVSFTVTTANASASTAPASAGALTTVQLPAGLTTTGTVTLTNGGTYSNATGLATFATTAALDPGTGIDNTITISQAPGTGPLVATAAVRGNESDPNSANNVASTSIAITLVVDVATTISGPATAGLGGPVAYTVVTASNGPSPTTGVQQQVVLPAGIVAYTVNGGPAILTNGGSASTAPTTVTLPTPSTIAAGAANAVANTVGFLAPAGPANFAYSVTASVTATADAIIGNNTATQSTARYNQPPVATNVTNTLQAPQGSTATASMLIAPLAATSATSSIKQFKLSSVPPTTQGVLYYDNSGTATAITTANYAALNLSPTQATTLRFLPAAGYVGNATFTYTATDNYTVPAVSNVATYLIPVGLDNSSVYARPTTTKGGANKYAVGDVLAYGIDPNAAQYNSAGLVYDVATGGAPATGTGAVSNGISVAKISAADSTSLAVYGIRFTRATALFTVFNPTLLPRAGASLPAVTVTTIDLNGGVNTSSVSLLTGASPLPVELTAFTAVAAGRDARLAWATASEQDNDRFEVERSFDGVTFARIATVAGQGSKAGPAAYALTDAGAAAKAQGPVYYRLRQVDAGGAATYSPVRAVSFAKSLAPAMALFPNPAVAGTQLDLRALPPGSYDAGIIDATGRVVAAVRLAGGRVHALDLAPLASGSYLVRVSGTAADGAALHLAQRLVKE